MTNPAPAPIPTLQQDITYTPFLQPETVEEGDFELIYTYGADYNRAKSELKQNGSTINTRYYFSGFEKDVTGGTTRYTQYISGPVGLVAIIESLGGSHTVHYTFTDHLGSILTVTDDSGTIEAEQSFDAWGRRRNPTSWKLLPPTVSTSLPAWLYRGYTAHEHLDQFGLINMNGRMYDPVLGRMLSPDNYVPDGTFTQDYNRYTYARNNPLVYTDPDGNFIVAAVIFGAALGGAFGYISGKAAGLTGWNLFGYTSANALIGGVSAGVGAAAGAGISASLSFGGFTGGGVAGAIGGATSGFVGAASSTLLNNATFGSTNSFVASGLKGAAIGGVLGGVLGGVSRGIADYRNGYNFWNGSRVDEFVLQGTASQNLAASYNSSSQAEINDDVLKIRMKDEFGVSEGSFNIRTITTRTGQYGLDPSGTYVNSKGQLVGGYVRYSSQGYSDFHISPRFTGADQIDFRAVAGHELIHVYHRSTIPNIKRGYTERVAYKYTFDTYMRAGRFYNAIQTYSTASTNSANGISFWGKYPSQYRLPAIFSW